MLHLLKPEVRSRLRSDVAICSVVQCVEELVLNSLDASAACVAVRVNLALGKVQIVDNGCGIDRQQMEMVAERYATSKIQSLADLDKLSQYGYRGEALASIRNLCYIFEIESRSMLSTETYTKVMKKGKLVQLSKSAKYRPSQGTTVTVYDLFHASPVRKKCLNECLELEWIKQRLEAFALVHPSVSFSLRNDATGSLILQTHKSNSVVGAFTHLFGVQHSQELCTFSNKTDMFQVRGYVSKVTSSNRNVQFVFVNNRLVLKTKLHSLINCILLECLVLKQTQKSTHVTSQTAEKKCENYCSDTFQPNSPQNVVDKHGIYIVMITCPLSEYEITFDPTKTLVEFRHWDILFKCVKNSLRELLQKEGLIESPHLNDTNKAVSSQQSLVGHNNVLTQDTGMTNCDANNKCYGKGIHACNISNNLQSNTVRRPVKDVMNIMEHSEDPAMLIERNETNSQNSSHHSISCGTIPGAVLSAASNSASDTLSGGRECHNRNTTSKMTANSGHSEATYKKHVGNNGKASTSCVISDDISCKSRAVFKSTSPTKFLHSDLAQHFGNNSVVECSSNNDTSSGHCQQGRTESNNATQTQWNRKRTTDISEAESEKPSVESISLTQMLQSSDDTKESSHDVTVRDHIFISLGTQGSYSSMNSLKDRDRQSSVYSTRAQLAPLKTLKDQLREEHGSQSSHLSSSLRSFKRDFGTKDRHKLLAGLSRVREKLSTLNQPRAQNKTRIIQKDKGNKELYCVDRMGSAALTCSNLAKSQTSVADTVQLNQSEREHLSKQGHCQSDIPGEARIGGITQLMCHGLPMQCPSNPAGHGTVDSNDANIVEQNNIPNVHKRLASDDITSSKAKKTQYHYFSKGSAEIPVKQISGLSENLPALSCQQVSRLDSNCGHCRQQVNGCGSNCDQYHDHVNRPQLNSNYGQCGDQVNRFDSNYSQNRDQVNRFDLNCSQSCDQINIFDSNCRQSHDQVNRFDSNCSQSCDQINRFDSNCGHSHDQVDILVSNSHQYCDQISILHSSCVEYCDQKTATINMTDEVEILSKRQPSEGTASHCRSFLTSDHLLQSALLASWKDAGEGVRNLGGNVEKHLAEQYPVLDIANMVTHRVDTETGCSRDTTQVDIINHLGGTRSSAVLHDSCLEDRNKGVHSTIDTSNALSVFTQDRSIGSYPHNTVIATNANPESDVGSRDKTQRGSVDNRLVLYRTGSQDQEMTLVVGSADDQQESTLAFSSQLMPRPAMIICNSEYDIEFVPLSVDVSDLESTSPRDQPNLMDVDMSPCFSHCSQESKGFQVSILTDKLSPSTLQQDCYPVGSVGRPMTLGCPVIDTTQPFHVTSGCSMTEMTTQPFEVTRGFQMDPTELDNGCEVTTSANSISAAQTGPECNKLKETRSEAVLPTIHCKPGVLTNTELSPNLKDVEDENQSAILKVFKKSSFKDHQYFDKGEECAVENTKVDHNKQRVEEQLKHCGNIQHVEHHWICRIQPETGTKMYVNLVTGNTCYEMPELLEKEALAESENMATVLIGAEARHLSLSHTASPLVPRPRCERQHCLQVAPLSPTSKTLLSVTLSGHLEDQELEDHVKWKGFLDDERCETAAMAQKLLQWQNPAFTLPEQDVCSIEVGHCRAGMTRVHRALHPCRFTRDMLSTTTVLRQLDNKFIVCLMYTDNHRQTGGSLLVVIDQHAADERVRLERLTQDAYEDCDTQERRLKTFKLSHPVTVTLSANDVRVMHSYRTSLKKIGIEFLGDHGRQDTVCISAVPYCLVNDDNAQVKLADTLQVLLQEQINLFCNTHGAASTLPKCIQRVLNSQACHGAIKFGDALTMEECTNLVTLLGRCQLPFQCAHGRPSIVPLLDLQHLNRTSKEQNSSRPKLWRLKSKKTMMES